MHTPSNIINTITTLSLLASIIIYPNSLTNYELVPYQYIICKHQKIGYVKGHRAS